MARPKKQPVDPNTLPGIAPKLEFRLGPFERAEVLEKITGLKDRDLRNICAQSRRANGDQYFPPPANGLYDTAATLKGLLDLERDRANRAKEMPVYQNIEIASQSTGISVKLLRQWKKEGCPGFRTRGDVVLEDVLRWLEPWLVGANEGDASELAAEGVSNWDEFRIKYQARNEKLKNQELVDQVVQKSVVIDTVKRVVGTIETLMQKMQSEYPTVLEGRDKKQIRAILDNDCKEKRDELRATLENFASTKRHEAAMQSA